MKDKSKIVTIVLAVVCVTSIIGVVYLYTANSSLKSENANLQSELEMLKVSLKNCKKKLPNLKQLLKH